MMMRVGAERRSLMRPASLWWWMQSPSLPRSRVVHPSTHDARASGSTRAE
jgi:hypothetical protein